MYASASSSLSFSSHRVIKITFTDFKNIEEEEKENCPLGDDLCERMNNFHNSLMTHVSLQALQAPVEEENPDEHEKRGPFKKLYNIINAVKELEEEPKPPLGEIVFAHFCL